jgi:hypothetical protein
MAMVNVNGTMGGHDDKQDQNDLPVDNAPGMAPRLAVCATGICVRYLYYGLL